MTVFTLKMIVMPLIFGIALLSGLIPVMAKQKRGRPSSVLLYGEHFAHGVFLATALLHLLPEALENYSQIYPQNHYPMILLICVLSIVLIQAVEQGALQMFHRHNVVTIPWVAYILMILLSLHSIIAGAALGFGADLSHVGIIFIAIISHKGAAAFALAVTMHKAGMARNLMVKMVVLFAMMTPIGILLSAFMHDYLQAQEVVLFEAIFGAIAAGTFLTVAFGEHGIHDAACAHDGNAFVKLSAVTLGVILMAVVAIWV